MVRCKRTGEEFALKQIRKDGMIKKNHRDRILAEKTLLSELKTVWVVTLYRTFQDSENLFMLMEYLPGGDLMHHLMRKDTFTEYETKFYIGELFEAVHAVHSLGFIHRDIKPDNIVLTAEGHLKLIDFGLCKFSPLIRENVSSSWTFRSQLKSTVGTPQYMAPEVIGKSYTHTSDYWSVGIIAFECLMGGTPFYDENASGTKKPDLSRIVHKVKNYKEYLLIPFPNAKQILSKEAIDFLKGILCDANLRINFAQIKLHPFFKELGVPLHDLRSLKAPIVPAQTFVYNNYAKDLHALPQPTKNPRDKNLDFVGYTYNRHHTG